MEGNQLNRTLVRTQVVDLTTSGMASPGPPVWRAMHDASNTGLLALDGLYEVLLHLSAKELYHLHTIYPPWRSLLLDPNFTTAHAAVWSCSSSRATRQTWKMTASWMSLTRQGMS
jgi:hypothetical protein